jgi:hypothetical protein
MVDDGHHERERSFRKLHTTLVQGRGVVVVGVVAAVVFPLVGVMIGVVLLFHARIGAGLACTLLSVLAGATYYLLDQQLL